MSFTLRQLTLALALCGLASSTFASDRCEPMRVVDSNGIGNTALHSATSSHKVRVLASLPVTYGLAKSLVN